MDWFVDGSSESNVSELRQSIAEYLRRHAAPGADLAAADTAVGELLANVNRHASGHAWINLDWSGQFPVVTVNDLGPGFDLDVSLPDLHEESGRGLFIVSHLTESLRVARRRSGGSSVRTTLGVAREPEESLDPPRRREGALPRPEEAAPDGSFGKESFLRALVVQLAQHVEGTYGPGAAEQAVAQVGTDVGGRMEDEYRRARELTDRLDPDQVADLYVRLKHAIEGDFYVIEANERLIRLGNRRCPFGEVVRQAPQLCRMTSSVFGGIAARNNDGPVLVQLEERIALGDPGCLVTVWLDTDQAPVDAQGHRYRQSAVAPPPPR